MPQPPFNRTKKINKDYVILKNCLVKVHKQNHEQTKQLHQPDLLVGKVANANIVSQPVAVSAVSIVVLEDCQFNKVHCWVYLQGIRPVQCGQNDGFCQMLQTLEPMSEMQSRKHFTEQATPALLWWDDREVVGSLQSAETIELTCDGWTSRPTESYLNQGLPILLIMSL